MSLLSNAASRPPNNHNCAFKQCRVETVLFHHNLYRSVSFVAHGANDASKTGGIPISFVTIVASERNVTPTQQAPPCIQTAGWIHYISSIILSGRCRFAAHVAKDASKTMGIPISCVNIIAIEHSITPTQQASPCNSTMPLRRRIRPTYL